MAKPEFRNRIKELRTVKASELIADEGNWRTHPKKQQEAMSAVLSEIGYADALLVRELDDGQLKLIDGHLRQELTGDSEVPVLVLDVDEDEARSLLVTFDPISAMAGASKEKLQEAIDRVQADQEGMKDLISSIAKTYKVILPEDQGKAGKAGDDEVPEDFESAAKTGDLFRLGRHLLLCGDSSKHLDVSRVFPGGDQYDLLVTDPPYGVSYADKNKFLNEADKGNRNQTEIDGDHESSLSMPRMWKSVFSTIRPFASDRSSYYIFSPQGGSLSYKLMQSVSESGFPLRHTLVWVKNNHVLGRCDYYYKHEPILYGWLDSHDFYSTQTETSTWLCDKPMQSKEHPTMKPVELFEKAVRNSSKPGGVVFDPFCGSGTLVIAAEKLKRSCRAIEIDPHYVDVIVNRWEAFTGEKAEKVEA